MVGGVPHVFQSFFNMMDEAGESLDRAARFVRQHLEKKH